MSKLLYYCTECKKTLSEEDDILYIQEKNPKGFCSEQCIDTHYELMRRDFLQQEYEIRHVLSASTEEMIPSFEQDECANIVLFNPSEKWRFENTLGESFYTHIHFVESGQRSFYAIYILSYIDGGPSYIYHKVFSKNENLVQEYRRGEKIVESAEKNIDLGGEEEFYDLDQEILDQVELMRSHFLADHLQQRDDLDIAFDQFHHYEDYIASTMENPDEIYLHNDDVYDEIYTYIKSYKKDEDTFFYVIICWESETNSEKMLIPIFSFPSINKELYKKYSAGKRYDSIIKN